jgi:hypothetical protein
MTREEAQKQAAKFAELQRMIDDSLRHLMRTAEDGRQFSEYRRYVGEIMGETFCGILDPIWRRYPEMEPPEMHRPPAPETPLNRALAEEIVRIVSGYEQALQDYEQVVAAGGDEYYSSHLEACIESARSGIKSVQQMVARSHPDLVHGREITSQESIQQRIENVIQHYLHRGGTYADPAMREKSDVAELIRELNTAVLEQANGRFAFSAAGAEWLNSLSWLVYTVLHTVRMQPGSEDLQKSLMQVINCIEAFNEVQKMLRGDLYPSDQTRDLGIANPRT